MLSCDEVGCRFVFSLPGFAWDPSALVQISPLLRFHPNGCFVRYETRVTSTEVYFPEMLSVGNITAVNPEYRKSMSLPVSLWDCLATRASLELDKESPDTDGSHSNDYGDHHTETAARSPMDELA